MRQVAAAPPALTATPALWEPAARVRLHSSFPKSLISRYCSGSFGCAHHRQAPTGPIGANRPLRRRFAPCWRPSLVVLELRSAFARESSRLRQPGRSKEFFPWLACEAISARSEAELTQLPGQIQAGPLAGAEMQAVYHPLTLIADDRSLAVWRAPATYARNKRFARSCACCIA
jgi:hypothetical protein